MQSKKIVKDVHFHNNSLNLHHQLLKRAWLLTHGSFFKNGLMNVYINVHMISDLLLTTYAPSTFI